jgi:hypothetical protein
VAPISFRLPQMTRRSLKESLNFLASSITINSRSGPWLPTVPRFGPHLPQTNSEANLLSQDFLNHLARYQAHTTAHARLTTHLGGELNPTNRVSGREHPGIGKTEVRGSEVRGPWVQVSVGPWVRGSGRCRPGPNARDLTRRAMLTVTLRRCLTRSSLRWAWGV